MENVFSTLPTPFELIFDPVSYIIFGLYGGLMLWEGLFPASKLPTIKYWRLKGILAFFLFFFLSSYLPILWNGFFAEYQLFNLASLGTYWGAFVGVMIYEFGIYFWHKAMHKNKNLWKIFHQLHHSAERMDTYGTFYFSPMDMIGFTLLSSLCLVLIAGFTTEASTLIILFTTFLSVFQHSNIKTHPWIGYFIQRPEAHAIHHAKGIHAYNYSDIPIFDIIFGTFNNPKGYSHESGFYPGASSKVFDMLMFKDISSNQDEK